MRNTKRPISPPDLVRPGAHPLNMRAYKSSKTLTLMDTVAPTRNSEFKSFNFPGINTQPILRTSNNNPTPKYTHKSPTKPRDRAIKITQNIFVSPK